MVVRKRCKQIVDPRTPQKKSNSHHLKITVSHRTRNIMFLPKCFSEWVSCDLWTSCYCMLQGIIYFYICICGQINNQNMQLFMFFLTPSTWMAKKGICWVPGICIMHAFQEIILQMERITALNLVLLNPDIPCLCKQCRSRSVCFCRSQLIWICTVCH